MRLHQLAKRLAMSLGNQAALPRYQIDRLRFGLEIIIGSLVKGILLFAAAWVLNAVPEVAVALATGSVFRLVAGGAHCTDYTGCLFLGLTVYLGVGRAAVYFGDILTSQLLPGLLVLGFCVLFTIVLRWVPGKVPGIELTQRKRRLFKALSIGGLLLWLGVTLYLTECGLISLALSSLLALAAQALSVTPLGYRLIEGYDRLLSRNNQRGEVMANAEQA